MSTELGFPHGSIKKNVSLRKIHKHCLHVTVLYSWPLFLLLFIREWNNQYACTQKIGHDFIELLLHGKHHIGVDSCIGLGPCLHSQTKSTQSFRQLMAGPSTKGEARTRTIMCCGGAQGRCGLVCLSGLHGKAIWCGSGGRRIPKPEVCRCGKQADRWVSSASFKKGCYTW